MADSLSTENPRRPASPQLVMAKTRVPPPGAKFVTRHDLISLLTEPGDRTVTVVRAPAGYGKSTLLTQWVEADPVRRFAWLSLDEADNDPTVLWRYILSALRAVLPGLADRAWNLLQQPQPDIAEVL